MTAFTSKFSENQYLSATLNRFPLMGQILAETMPKLTLAAASHAGFSAVLTELTAVEAAWSAGETALSFAEATLPAMTLGFNDKMASLTRQPDINTASPLESWALVIRSVVAFSGPVYTHLLPRGRRTLRVGTRTQQLEAGHAFALRLAEQTAYPALVALAAPVSAFYNQAQALRNAQIAAKVALDNARTDQERRRIAAAEVLYRMVGVGMSIYYKTPKLVDTLITLHLLRRRPTKRRRMAVAEPEP